MWFKKTERNDESENLIKIESDIRETALKVFGPMLPTEDINYDRAIEAILIRLNDRITVLENQVDSLLEDSHY